MICGRLAVRRIQQLTRRMADESGMFIQEDTVRKLCEANAGATRENRRSAFASLAVAVLCLVAGYYLFSSAVLIENACFLEGDRTCVEALRRVWLAFGLAGGFVVITSVVFASFVRRAWRRRRR